MSAKPPCMWGLALMGIATVAAAAFGTLSFFAASFVGIAARQQATVAASVPGVVVPVLLPLGVGLFCGSFIVVALKPGYSSTLPKARSAGRLAAWGTALIGLALLAYFATDPLMHAYANYLGLSADSPGSLQFGVASTFIGILNLLLLPVGIGFVPSSFVEAALPHSITERWPSDAQTDFNAEINHKRNR